MSSFKKKVPVNLEKKIPKKGASFRRPRGVPGRRKEKGSSGHKNKY
jgi:hypothetical protein